MSDSSSGTLSGSLLKEVSRSFYLTLRALPAPVRPQIGLAYLLARTADTIADTALVPAADRLAALQTYRERLLGAASPPLDFRGLAGCQASPAEARLLSLAEPALAELRRFSPADQTLIREVLGHITSGQVLDLLRFGGVDRAASAPGTAKIIALETGAELDDYLYRVAGSVGEFWTKICRARIYPAARLDDARMVADGIRFGKGLQLVNILRDLPVDLKHGRCYLPTQRLDEAGLYPGGLLSPVKEEAFRAVYQEYLDKAEAHLAAGWRYTLGLPFGQWRLRLACAWPVLIGLRTTRKLRSAGVLQLQQRVKVSRAEVWRLMLGSVLASPFPWVWRRLAAHSAGRPLAGDA